MFIEKIKKCFNEHRKIIQISIIVFILFASYFVYKGIVKTNAHNLDNSSSANLPVKDVQIDERILVQITGEVNKPGVYEMNNNDRLQDLIQIAGGFTKHADKEAINLTQKLTDEMVIQIPRKIDFITSDTNNKISVTITNGDKRLEEVVSGLNGIGISKAQKIIDYRNQHGKFTSIEQLKEVLTESTFEKIKNDVTL